MARSIASYFTKNVLTVLLAIIIVGLGIYIVTDRLEREETVVETSDMPDVPIDDRRGSSTAETGPGNLTYYCFQLDGRGGGHVPHLLGENLPDTYRNTDGGYNYGKRAVASPETDNHGPMPNGSIFAKEKWLMEVGMVNEVYLISGITGWQPVKMEKDGDIYVYNP